MRGIFCHKFFFDVHGRLQATCSRPSAACTQTHWWCHQGVIKYYLRGMCSNSNVWLETRTQASPAIRVHARTSNHHPSKKYLTTTSVQHARYANRPPLFPCPSHHHVGWYGRIRHVCYRRPLPRLPHVFSPLSSLIKERKECFPHQTPTWGGDASIPRT